MSLKATGTAPPGKEPEEVMSAESNDLHSNRDPAPKERKRKHSSISLRDKLEVLHRMDKGESATKLAEEFRVGRATISDWKKNRPRIERFCITTSVETLAKRHTSKISPFDKVDDALYIWFMEEREKGSYITGPIIQEKALELNRLLQGENNFAASNGWLDRWKKRHGIRLFSSPADQDLATADRVNKNIHWVGDDLLIGHLPPGVDSADNSSFYGDFSPQESCTPDFKLGRDYYDVSDHGAHNLAFTARTRRPVDTTDSVRGTDVLRERFKQELAAAVKRYSEPLSKRASNRDNIYEEVPQEILQLVKETPEQDCDDQEDLSEWVTTDISEDLESGDEAQMVGTDTEVPVSSRTAVRALDLALRYVRHHSEATPADIMVVERWRNIAASAMLNEMQ